MSHRQLITKTTAAPTTTTVGNVYLVLTACQILFQKLYVLTYLITTQIWFHTAPSSKSKGKKKIILRMVCAHRELRIWGQRKLEANIQSPVHSDSERTLWGLGEWGVRDVHHARNLQRLG